MSVARGRERERVRERGLASLRFGCLRIDRIATRLLAVRLLAVRHLAARLVRGSAACGSTACRSLLYGSTSLPFGLLFDFLLANRLLADP